jgi:hypothetical protein
MAFEHVVKVANDGDLQQRIAACYALNGGTEDPVSWATDRARMWWFATQANWADAYYSAELSFIDRPGLRPGAITDAMIETAVDARMTLEAQA